MPDLTCSYCRRSNLDPGEKNCPACGAPLEAPAISVTPPELEALPEIEGFELPSIPPLEEPTGRNKPSPLLWIAIAAGGLCLLAVLCALIFTLLAIPARRQGSGRQSPAVEVIRPTVTARQQALISTPAPALADPDLAKLPSPTLPTDPTPPIRPEGSPYIGELTPEFTLLDAELLRRVRLIFSAHRLCLQPLPLALGDQ